MKLRALGLLALLLLLPSIASAQTATPTLPFCATPGGATATPVPTYSDKVISYSPFVYWPMDEGAGTIAIDATGNGRHATYSGVTLNSTTFVNGDRAPGFDGVNDYTNIYSAINGVFSGSAGTISGWAKAVNTVWSDSATNRIFNIQATSVMRLESSSGTNNTLSFNWNGKTYNHSTSTTDWFHWAITWNSAGDTVVFYFNGTAVSTQNSLSAWSGTLNSAGNVLGAANTSGVTPWSGNIAHVALWTTALNGTQIADLAVVPTGTPTPTPTPTCQVYNPTATPTPNLYAVWTLVPGAGETSGQAVAVNYQMSIDGITIAVLLFAIFLMLLIAFVFSLRQPRR